MMQHHHFNSKLLASEKPLNDVCENEENIGECKKMSKKKFPKGADIKYIIAHCET